MAGLGRPGGHHTTANVCCHANNLTPTPIFLNSLHIWQMWRVGALHASFLGLDAVHNSLKEQGQQSCFGDTQWQRVGHDL